MLLPGQSEVVEFRIRALRTGRTAASSARSPCCSVAAASFELFSAVGDGGVPLSPSEIVLRRRHRGAAARTAAATRRGLDRALFLGRHRRAVSQIGPDVPLVTRQAVAKRASQLASAGQAVRLGESEFVALARLGAEWLGAADHDTEWDLLRRRSRRGGQLAGAESPRAFAAEITEAGASGAFAQWIDAIGAEGRPPRRPSPTAGRRCSRC